MRDSNWDIDLRDGLAGESMVADLLSLDTVEVKTDRRWWETGNIYIETEFWSREADNWVPSGIRVSNATHWAYVLEETVIIVPLEQLKEAVWTIGRPITCNIPSNPSRGYLVTPSAILDFIRSTVRERKEMNG